jgi:HlyD family secretion protein
MKFGRPTKQFALTGILIASMQGCYQSSSQTLDAGRESTASEGSRTPASPQPPALVRVVTIRSETIAPDFRAVGNIRPRFVSIVASGADGVVEEFSTEVGKFVSQGTLLCQLRNESTNLEIAGQEALLAECRAELEEIRIPRKEDEAEAEARKRSADIAYANAERRMEELTALSRRGAANESEVKDARDALDAADQTRRAAVAIHSRISNPRPESVLRATSRVEAQENHVSFLKAEREKRATKAPFDGFVVQEHTYVGQWLSKGDPVVTLADLAEVEAEVQIDQQFIDQIAPGRPVTLHIQGTGSRDGQAREWTGKVDSVVPRSNWQNGSRSFPVIVRIENEINESTTPPVPALREGMMAEATFRGAEVNAVLVPKDSMVRTSRGTFIYVINPTVNGDPPSVRQVIVEPGLSSGTRIQVSGENIEAGMQVVTDGAERLRAFQTVEIVNEDAEPKQ